MTHFFENKFVLLHGVVDLRKGAAGLLSLVGGAELGVCYFFSNRSRSLLKCVYRDKHGVWVATRRLESGTFQWFESVAGSSVLTSEQVTELCAGMRLNFSYEDFI